jgi:hypothetical protein
MGRPLYSNNAATYLAFGITNTATTMQVSANAGSLFPTPTGGDYFYVSLISLSGPIIEIVKCTARSGDVFTIERGQEGTSALYWNMGDNVQLRITAAGMNYIAGSTASTTLEQTFTATQGQTVFNITNFDYAPGTNNLAVFVNGSKQVSGTNYSETNVNTVTFTAGLNVGDIVEFLSNLSVAAGTIYATDINYNEGQTGAVTRTLESKLQESVSVKDFGADATGATASDTAFASAWSFIQNTGGSLLIPPGTYLLNSTWTCTIPTSAGYNYFINGYGATIKSGASVTGWAISVVNGFENFGLRIQGLNFYQVGNTTVSGAIQGISTANLKLIDCTVQLDNNKSAYAAFQLQNTTPGDGGGCFWTLIDGCTTRQLSGNVATYAPIGINLVAQANATKIVNCSFGSIVNAIKITRDSSNGNTINGLRILNNDFEGMTNCLTIDTSSPATYAPTGVFLAFNRVESATTFINWSGTAVTDPSQPLLSQSNYLTVGSVTNYTVNPNNQIIFTQENSFFGVPVQNYIGSPSNFNVLTNGTGTNLQITTTDGTSSWQRAHLVFGSTYQPYHLWVDTSGRLRIKLGAPTSATDGTVVGTQA